MGLPEARDCLVDGRAWQTEHLWPRLGNLSTWLLEYGVEAVEVLGGDCKTVSWPEPELLAPVVGVLLRVVLHGLSVWGLSTAKQTAPRKKIQAVRLQGIIPCARLSRSKGACEVMVGTPVAGRTSLGGIAADLLHSGDLTC